MTPVTLLLIAINVIAFAWLWFTGGPESNVSLVEHGAIVPSYVREQGEWWRIVTAAFLHSGLLHIGMNMFALAQIGTVVEELAGSVPMLFVYAVSLLGSGLSIVVFGGDAVTVGASGAIYGLFGGLIAIGLRLGEHGRTIVVSILPVVVVNIALTFAIPNISISGHIGGLICGFLAALGLHVKRMPFLGTPQK